MNSNMKVCTKCLSSKEESLFYKRASSKNGLDSWCKECSSKDRARIYILKKDKKLNQSKEYYINNKKKISEKAALKKNYIREQRRNAGQLRKSLVLKEYGGSCTCCGESEEDFLSIDHINNDGNIHRRELKEKFKVGAGSGFYRWIVANNFPKGNLQALCMNCQTGKRINNGVCAHALRKK